MAAPFGRVHYNMSECLTAVDFERVSAGTLDEAALALLREHLTTCRACQTAFAKHQESARILDRPALLQTQADSQGEVTQPESLGSASRAATPVTERMRRHFPKIEGYRIVGVLGQGGMGIVYQAVQTKLERTVALKVLPAIVGSANPAAVARFRREATAAARLHHTNIVPIYDFGESSEAYYYAMELIVGQPLNVLIHEFGKLKITSSSPTRLADVMRATILGEPEDSIEAWKERSEDWRLRSGSEDSPTRLGTSSSGKGQAYYHQVARWMSDAAEALHYAHAAGIIHRDVKPANLIVASDGRIMVADFGLAKEVAEESVTMTGSLLGTLRYVSPEQAMAKRVRVDHRTDIYSLGATMYELLCFQPAYGGSDEKEILGQIISRDPVSPRKILSSVPHELETICIKCMEKSKDARYDTARALAEDLRRYINDLPIAAKRPGTVRLAIKFIRRHRALVTAVTAAVLIVAASWYGVRQAAHRKVAEEQRRAAEVNALYESGFTYSNNGRDNVAEKEWTKALQLNPQHVPTLTALFWMKARQLQRLPDNEKEHGLGEVVRFGRQVLDIDPNNVEALAYLGVMLRRLHRYEDAITLLQKAIDLAPHKYVAWSNLGTTYAVTGDWEQAAKYLAEGAKRAADAKDQWSAAAWRNLASFELFRGMDAAAEHISHAINCHTNDAMSWVIRARVKMQLPSHIDLKDALGDAEYADRNANEKNPKAKRIRALALLNNDDFEAAARHANLALELGDLPFVNHLIIAIANARLGNMEEARRSAYRAEDAWPETLKSKGDVEVTADNGVLWFETADELLALKAEAKALLAGHP